MRTLFHTTLIISILSLPVVFFLSYLNVLRTKAEFFIEQHTSKSSKYFRGINVYIKNFDVFNKTNMFRLNPFHTAYDFSTCDLILDSNRLMVIGKMKILGKTINLMPTLLTNSDYFLINFKNARIAFCEDLREVGSDLEIDFKDTAYDSTITLVIKRATEEMREKIKNELQRSA